MSGPKIIRVITREELVDQCSTLLRQLDRKIADWLKETGRLGFQDVAAEQAVMRRREEIAAHLKADRFAEIQKQVPMEMAFLTHDIDQKRQQAASRAAQRAQVARRHRENAEALLRELQQRELTPPNSLSTHLRRVALGDLRGSEAEAILAQGLACLASRPESQAMTAAQQDLARRLQPSDSEPGVAPWRPESPRLKQIDEALARLEVQLGTVACEVFARRLRDIEATADDPTVGMLLDTLVLDLGSALQQAKVEADLLTAAEEVAVELDHALAAGGDQSSAALGELRAAIDSRVFDRLSDLVLSGRRTLHELAKTRVAGARRAAVLEGLAALGYEVREGMSTAWADQGRVVVRNPHLPGYGVELSGAADADRLQVRAVAFDANRDALRDRDIETVWCGDFTKLRKMIDRHKGSVIIERAIEIGALPLKVIDDVGSEPSSVAAVVGREQRRNK